MVHLDLSIGGRVMKVAFEPIATGLRVVVDGREHLVDARAFDGFFYSLLIDRRSYEVTVEENEEGFRVQMGADAVRVARLDPLRPARGGASPSTRGAGKIRSIMPGKVVRVLVEAGEQVRHGQPLLVLEAMKMENEVQAPVAGRVARILVEPGSAVEAGAELAVIE